MRVGGARGSGEGVVRERYTVDDTVGCPQQSLKPQPSPSSRAQPAKQRLKSPFAHPSLSLFLQGP
jgi:hypothetical protein